MLIDTIMWKYLLCERVIWCPQNVYSAGNGPGRLSVQDTLFKTRVADMPPILNQLYNGA
jgi:hypothetical protein